jgi:tetratricopeptide (TPR) repeat protein
LKNEPLALDDLNRALALRPHYPQSLSRRAAVYATMGMFDPAIADWELALALDPLDAHYAKQLERANRYRLRKDLVENPTADKWIGAGVSFLLVNSILGAVGLLAYWFYRKARVRAGALPDPSDTLEIDPVQPLGFRIWRLYLWLISLLHLGLYATRWSSMTQIDRFVDVPITGIALLGALGYVQRWRLMHVRLWQLWAFVFPVWNVTLHFVFQHAELYMWPTWGFTHLICAPVYAALLIYGFYSKTIWGELDSIPLVYRDELLEQHQ